LYNLEDLLLYAREFQKHKLFGQVSLFGQAEIQLPPLRLKEAPALSKWEKVNWEKELLGLFVSEHPMKDYQIKLRLEYGASNIKDALLKIGQNVKIGGLITGIKKILTRNNQPMIFSQLEDVNSKVELIVFNDLIQKNPALWQENNIVVVKGRVNEKDGVPKIICQEVTPVATLS
jgi:DNA polymerase-3 subunit alpha